MALVVLAGSASAYTSTSVAWCLITPRWASPPQQPLYQTRAMLRYAACLLTTAPLPMTRPTCCGKPWTPQSCSNTLITSARLSCQPAGKPRCSSRHFSSAATVGCCCTCSESHARCQPCSSSTASPLRHLRCHALSVPTVFMHQRHAHLTDTWATWVGHDCATCTLLHHTCWSDVTRN